MKLEQVFQENKPLLRDCRVFYINVGNIMPSAVSDYTKQIKNDLKDQFDTSNVLFVYSREHETGWQFPND